MTANQQEFGPISTSAELEATISQVAASYPDCTLLFRGQRRIHSTVRSGRSRSNEQRPARDVEAGWRALATHMLGLPLDAEHDGLAKAILQHYGMATHFVDVTSDAEVAAWFACNTLSISPRLWIGTALRSFEEAVYSPSEEELGYLLIFAMPKPEELKRKGWLFNLSDLPEHFVRPHRQRGWLLYDRPPAQPEPATFWVATVSISARLWSSKYNVSHLFPSPRDDAAYSVLARLPFVQVPNMYPEDSNPASEPSTPRFEREGDAPTEASEVGTQYVASLDRYCLAMRLLKFPEYQSGHDSHETFDHKWDDLVLYEPHPMRLWKRWTSDLASVYPDMRGNIQDTIKITLSKGAFAALMKASKAKCKWPDLGADGLLFTFAEHTYDKFDSEAKVYNGIWLQRDDDFIMETPVSSDENVLSVHQGHGYLLRRGKVAKVDIPNSCQCGLRWHERTVKCALRLSYLLERGHLIMLPHPLKDLGWYVVTAPGELGIESKSRRRAGP